MAVTLKSDFVKEQKQWMKRAMKGRPLYFGLQAQAAKKGKLLVSKKPGEVKPAKVKELEPYEGDGKKADEKNKIPGGASMGVCQGESGTLKLYFERGKAIPAAERFVKYFVTREVKCKTVKRVLIAEVDQLPVVPKDDDRDNEKPTSKSIEGRVNQLALRLGGLGAEESSLANRLQQQLAVGKNDADAADDALDEIEFVVGTLERVKALQEQLNATSAADGVAKEPVAAIQRGLDDAAKLLESEKSDDVEQADDKLDVAEQSIANLRSSAGLPPVGVTELTAETVQAPDAAARAEFVAWLNALPAVLKLIKAVEGAGAVIKMKAKVIEAAVKSRKPQNWAEVGKTRQEADELIQTARRRDKDYIAYAKHRDELTKEGSDYAKCVAGQLGNPGRLLTLAESQVYGDPKAAVTTLNEMQRECGELLAGKTKHREGMTGGIAEELKAKVEGKDNFKYLQQLAKLKEIDVEISKRAGARYQEAAELDSTLMTDTAEKKKKVPDYKPFGEKETAALIKKMKTSVDLSTWAADEFKDYEKDLHKTLKSNSKTRGAAEQHARDLIANSKPEALMDFLAKSVDERREEIAKGISGLAKNPKGTSYADLSSDRKKLVDSILSGIHDGLSDCLAEATRTYEKDAKDRMQKVVKGLDPKSDLMFSLSMKSAAELKADAALALGLVKPDDIEQCKYKAEYNVAFMGTRNYKEVVETQTGWMNSLTADQRILIDSLANGMAAAIEDSAPNRIDPGSGVLTLNGETYERIDKIGSGGMGDIFRYRNKGTGEIVVVKSLQKPHKRLEMERELTVHREAMGGEGGKGHPNVAPMRGVVRGPDESLHMIMDEAKGGDLRKVSDSIQQAVDNGVLPESARTVLMQQFIRDAVAGLRVVQDNNLTSHDIKPQNFLLGESGTVMITDFGSGQLGHDTSGSVKSSEEAVIETTPGYEAPELRKGQSLSGKADTFSLGVMINELTGGDSTRYEKAAFEGKHEAREHMSALDKLTLSMMDPDPKRRPTLAAVENCSFLRDAGVHDEEQVKKLMSATMEYSKIVAKQLDRKPAGQTDTISNGLRGIKELIENEYLRIRDAKAKKTALLEELAIKKAGLQDEEKFGKLEFERKTGKLEEEYKKKLEKCDQDIESVTKKSMAKIAELKKDREVYEIAAAEILKSDPQIQDAARKLKEASAPFSGVVENPKAMLPDLRRRLKEIVGQVQQIQYTIPGLQLHAKLSGKLMAALNHSDREEAVECRTVLRELEDLVATVAGNKKLQQLVERRDQLKNEKALKERLPSTKSQVPEIESELKNTIEEMRSIVETFVG